MADSPWRRLWSGLVNVFWDSAATVVLTVAPVTGFTVWSVAASGAHAFRQMPEYRHEIFLGLPIPAWGLGLFLGLVAGGSASIMHFLADQGYDGHGWGIVIIAFLAVLAIGLIMCVRATSDPGSQTLVWLAFMGQLFSTLLTYYIVQQL